MGVGYPRMASAIPGENWRYTAKTLRPSRCMMPQRASMPGFSPRMRASSISLSSTRRISPRRERSLCATMVPSGMVTAIKIMPGLDAISSSST